MDGREARVARAQHDHLRLAEVSAQIAIAERLDQVVEELQGLRGLAVQVERLGSVLAERLPDPYWAERAEAENRAAEAEPTYRDPHEPPGAAQDWRG
jgi:hypothetical protein